MNEHKSPDKDSLLDRHSIFKLIDSVSFFAEFTEEEKFYLAGLESHVLRYFPNQYVIEEGAVAEDLYVLLKGVVCITKTNKPQDIILTKLKTGSIFGELGWLGKRARITNVVADGEVIVLRLDFKNINTLAPALQIKIKDQIIKVLIGRLDDTNHQLAKLAR